MQLMQFGNFAISFLFFLFCFPNSYPCQGANQTGVYWGRAFRPLLGAHLRCFTGEREKVIKN